MAFVQFDSIDPSELDQKVFSPDLFDDNESIDTSSVMDQPIMTPSTTERKSSMSTSSSAFFPSPSSANPWDDYLPTAGSSAQMPDRQDVAGQYAGHLMSNNPFHPQNNWVVFEHTPDSKTPVAPATYQPYIEQGEAQPEGFFSNPFNQGSMVNNDVPPSTVMPPKSAPVLLPTSSPMALAEEESETHRMNKRLRQSSPSRTMSPAGFFRSDGVRKKNHKMEIPLGITLANIDRLISECKDPERLKEYKQQKRLLRNRQAALDSRQRKKKHTEDLEEEKKSWLDQRSMYQQEVIDLQEQMKGLMMENNQYAMQNAEMSQQIQNMNSEKEDIIVAHTLETESLRRKIMVLTSELQRPADSHHSDYSEFDPMNLSEDWNRYIEVNDDDDISNHDQPEHQPAQNQSHVPEKALVLGQPRKDLLANDSETSSVAPTSAMLLLLLYGAFVAATSSSSLKLPAVPDHYRAEAGKILRDLDVLKDDSTITQQQHGIPIIQGSSTISVIPAVSPWMQPDKQASQNFFTTADPNAPLSSFDALTSRLMVPSREAQIEAAFSLTPAQYNSLTQPEWPPRVDEEDDGCATPVPGEANKKGEATAKRIEETLRKLRQERDDEHTPAVYKRSLMWDRVPADVLREFRRMVREDDVKIKDETDVR